MLIPLLRAHLRPYVREVAAVIALLTLQSIANLYLPNLNADIINNGVVKGDTGYIIRIGGVMLLVTIGQSIVSIVAVYFASRAALSVGRDLRAAVFSRVQDLSTPEVARFGAPSLITRNTNDVQQIQIFMVMGLTMMVAAPIIAIGGVAMALYENAELSLLLLVIVPLMAGIVALLVSRAVPLFRAMQGRIDRINQVLREQISGIRVVRAFVRTDYERRRFAHANDDLTLTALRVNRIFSVMFPVILLIFNLSSVAVIWFGGHLVDSGSMPIGNLTAFLAYLLQILMAVMMASMMTILIPRANASAERIYEVLATRPAITEPESPAEAASRTGRVEFREVTFRYPGAADPVLVELSLTMQPGTTTAIVGGTGSGKTTLINLIARLFDVTEGTVLVDGVDVREQSLQSLWDEIGLVPQTGYLFTGTVAENLRMGRAEVTDEDLWRALEVAQAKDFVTEMPAGLQSPLAQGGTTVSGGQRQRLAIARALVKRPRIYLFDDSFSALDAGTDARLRAALPSATHGATVVIVSQRVSSIMSADQIVVLDQGAIVGVGTHSELMKRCETYRDLVESQLGEQVA